MPRHPRIPSWAAVGSILLSALPAQVAAAEAAFAPDKVTAALRKFFALELAPGMAVAVVRGDKVLYRKGFGFADVKSRRRVTLDTCFYIASSTKSFTGTAMAILDHEGVMHLDAPMTKYLSGVTYHPEIEPASVSMRDLMTHTHGIENNGPVAFRLAYNGQHTPKLLRKLLRHHGAGANGKKFLYTNVGFNIAGLAIDETLKTSWKDVLAEKIFSPLGMKNTSAYGSKIPMDTRALPYAEEPIGFRVLPYVKSDANMHSAGGMMTTVNDMARWLIVNLNQGRLDGRQVIPAAAIAAAHKPYAKQNREGEFPATGYGLGWSTGELDGTRLIHHFGGFAGFHSHVSFLPDANVGVVLFANSGRFGSLLAQGAARYLYDRLRNKDTDDLEARLERIRSRVTRFRAAIQRDRDRRAARPQQLPHPLATYTGRFANPIYGTVEFALRDGALVAKMGLLSSAVEVYDNKRNLLRVELTGSGMVVAFAIEDGAKRAKSIRLVGETFERVGR